MPIIRSRLKFPGDSVFRFVLIATLIAVFSTGATAQKIDRSLPVLLDADEINYDENLGIVTASGNVELSQGERVLLADSVNYNQSTNTVSASGNVKLLEPTGEVLFAEHVELTDDMREGFLRGLRMLLVDNSRIAAVNARRLGGVATELNKAVYSPCLDCLATDGTPFWQLTARKVTHNTETREVVYRDAKLEMLGVPVAYTPYLSHPDPSVKRKSGFLAPSFVTSGALGAAVRAPYFWAIDDFRDFTFDPILSTDVIAILTGEYRQSFTKGELRSRVSATRDDAQTGTDRFRGHVDAFARFDVDDTWRWGTDIKAATDDTYLARYGFPYENTLTSQLFAEGFTQRNYARVDAQFYQGLRNEDDQNRIPIVAPNANYNFVGDPNNLGAFFTFDANALGLIRTGSETINSRRVSLITGWELPHIGTYGDVTEIRATLQTDLYNVSNVPDPASSSLQSGFTGRLFPKLSVNWRYPWVRRSGNSSQIIEPILSLVASPNGSNPDKIPNEDSLAFEFDETNLFERDRFAGTDRVDGGTRAAYGLRIGAFGAGGGNATAVFGQSYRLREDSTYPTNSGLKQNFSDFVGRISVSPNKYVDLLYKTRIDKDSLDSRRTEIGGAVGVRALRVGADYVFFDGTEEFPADREELSLNATSEITHRWTARANTRRDLTPGGGTLSYGGSLTYHCDCMTFEVSYRRTFTSDRDVPPDETIFVRLNLKSLGELGTEVF